MSYSNCIVHPIGDDQLISAAIEGLTFPLKNRKLIITRPVIIPELFTTNSIVGCELIIMRSLNPDLAAIGWCQGAPGQVFVNCKAYFE